MLLELKIKVFEEVQVEYKKFSCYTKTLKTLEIGLVLISMDEFVRAVHWVVLAHFYTFHSWAGMDQFYIWARFLDFHWQ